MDVLCVGMYRACSTWQYNIACQLAERHRNGQRLGFLPGTAYCPKPGQWRVLKSHDHHDTFADALKNQHALALYSYRDLRDVAFSLVHKYQRTFEYLHERRLMLHGCLETDRFWMGRSGVLVQRYEDIMSDPARAVAQIADHLGIPLVGAEVHALVAEHSFEANRKRTDELARSLQGRGTDLHQSDNACLFDQRTLLHWNHLRTGANGQWRETVTLRELVFLAAWCTDWLLARGYESSPTWWTEIIAQRGWNREEVGAAWIDHCRDRNTQSMQEEIEILQRRVDEQVETVTMSVRRLAEAEQQLLESEQDRAQTHTNYFHSQAALQEARGLLAEALERWHGLEQHGETAVTAATRVARIIGGLRSMVRRWRGNAEK